MMTRWWMGKLYVRMNVMVAGCILSFILGIVGALVYVITL